MKCGAGGRGVTIRGHPQSSSRERAASMSDVGTLAAMDAFAGGARRRPSRLPPPPPFVPPPPPQRHDHYYVRRKSPVPRHSSNLTLFARSNGTSPPPCCTTMPVHVKPSRCNIILLTSSIVYSRPHRLNSARSLQFSFIVSLDKPGICKRLHMMYCCV